MENSKSNIWSTFSQQVLTKCCLKHLLQRKCRKKYFRAAVTIKQSKTSFFMENSKIHIWSTFSQHMLTKCCLKYSLFKNCRKNIVSCGDDIGKKRLFFMKNSRIHIWSTFESFFLGGHLEESCPTFFMCVGFRP